jgi:hypothetical protein
MVNPTHWQSRETLNSRQEPIERPVWQNACTCVHACHTDTCKYTHILARNTHNTHTLAHTTHIMSDTHSTF